MKLQENIKRNLCPSLESLKGGTFLLSPPPRINQAGDNSQGGGTHTPVPPVSALVCVHMIWMIMTMSLMLSKK